MRYSAIHPFGSIVWAGTSLRQNLERRSSRNPAAQWSTVLWNLQSFLFYLFLFSTQATPVMQIHQHPSSPESSSPRYPCQSTKYLEPCYAPKFHPTTPTSGLAAQRQLPRCTYCTVTAPSTGHLVPRRHHPSSAKPLLLQIFQTFPPPSIFYPPPISLHFYPSPRPFFYVLSPPQDLPSNRAVNNTS